jgi:hypothetical protein
LGRCRTPYHHQRKSNSSNNHQEKGTVSIVTQLAQNLANPHPNNDKATGSLAPPDEDIPGAPDEDFRFRNG